MPTAKQLDEQQQALLADLEKGGPDGGKTVHAVFEEHRIRPAVLEEWLATRAFMRAIEKMRRRLSFRLEQELAQGAAMAGERLHQAVIGPFGEGIKTAQVQAMVNTIRLCEALVRSPALKRELAAAKERAERRRESAGLPPGYHRNNTPERAQALLRRLQKRRRREERLDRDQDENGTWMPAD